MTTESLPPESFNLMNSEPISGGANCMSSSRAGPVLGAAGATGFNAGGACDASSDAVASATTSGISGRETPLSEIVVPAPPAPIEPPAIPGSTLAVGGGDNAAKGSKPLSAAGAEELLPLARAASVGLAFINEGDEKPKWETERETCRRISDAAREKACEGGAAWPWPEPSSNGDDFFPPP